MSEDDAEQPKPRDQQWASPLLPEIAAIQSSLNKTAKSEPWSPNFADLVAVGALIAAVVMWFAPPEWKVGAAVVVISIGLVVFTALRHRSHLAIRGPIAAVVIFILCLVAWHPIWTSFRKEYPATIPEAAEPPAPPPADPNPMPSHLLYEGPFQSTYGKVLIQCYSPPVGVATMSEYIQQKEYIRQNMKAWGEAIGFDFTVKDVTNGIRIELEATTDEAQRRLWIAAKVPVTKIWMELRRVDRWIVVSYVVDWPKGFDFFKVVRVDPDSQDMIDVRKRIEFILSLPEGKCKIF